jgi:hypothetical protein
MLAEPAGRRERMNDQISAKVVAQLTRIAKAMEEIQKALAEINTREAKRESGERARPQR